MMVESDMVKRDESRVPDRPPALAIDPGRVTGTLAAFAAMLVALSIVGQVIFFTTGHDTAMGFIPFFHVGTELNLTTYFSALMLLGSGLLLGAIGWQEAKSGGDYARHWMALATLFVLLSVDEITTIHERLIIPVRDLLDTTGILYFAWVIPYVLLVVIVGIVFLRFLLALPRTTRRYFVAAAIVFVGGALGMELLGGLHYEEYGDQTPTYQTLIHIEESLEMAGVIVFIHGLLLHLASHAPWPDLRIHVGRDPADHVPIRSS